MMINVFLQYWLYSDSKYGVLPHGCSLHIDILDRDMYVSNVYKNRGDDIPNSYEKIIGESIIVEICPELYSMLVDKTNIKLHETEMRNLILTDKLNVC